RPHHGLRLDARGAHPGRRGHAHRRAAPRTGLTRAARTGSTSAAPRCLRCRTHQKKSPATGGGREMLVANRGTFALVGAGLIGLAVAPGVLAAEDEDNLDEIVVTGS